jgi:glycosyltransferase involved in cell wall biosynthesis
MRSTAVANGIAPKRVAITPPPLPDAAYTFAPAARPSERTLLFASRLTPRKGLRSLLGALAKMAPGERPRLVVVGEGEAEERDARAQAARDGIAVDWRGKLSAAELRDAIDAADAVAVPSLWPEPFGLVGIEAQARGRPAVAYSVGGIGDWIGGAGIAVRRGDETALAAAIRAVLSDGVWSGFAATARTRAEAYRLDTHVERLLDIFDGKNGTT